MSNITIKQINNSSVVIADNAYEDGLLVFLGSGTALAGTILAVDSTTLKYIPFVKGGVTNENGIPKAVLVEDVTSATAGDVPIRPLVAGEVRKDKLIIAADGDSTNVDKAVLDQLRDYSIVARTVSESGQFDNA